MPEDKWMDRWPEAGLLDEVAERTDYSIDDRTAKRYDVIPQ